MENKSFEKSKGKEHLDKGFLEELKHKIWSTKGTRFTADRRLKTISKYSTYCINFLSAYLTIFGLISVYNLYNESKIEQNVIAFAITGFSLLVLVFSIIESSENYLLKAKNFHDCALDLSDLYNELQNFKAYEENATDEIKRNFCQDLQKKYQNVLRKYDNHHPIDNEFFKLKHPDYYKTKWYEFVIIKLKYFYYTRFIYLLLIILPAIYLFRIVCKAMQ
ncbi:SLATT domain-containing protein [Flavobacterium croceum]|uniref:SLATT domain-containing protein n=1 Tax=Flavobacterium croceum TaxID=370975 RepID=UPI0024A80F43|nr:SLATT domain-containing protein [Flavobacterium croceum]